jgi:hypothetical protein
MRRLGEMAQAAASLFWTTSGAGKEIGSEGVVETLQAICAHHHPLPHVVAA